MAHARAMQGFPRGFYSVDHAQGVQRAVQRLVTATKGRAVNTDQAAQIRSFAVNFHKFAHTPDFLRIILQPEFGFDCMIDLDEVCDTACDIFNLKPPLEWPSSVFINALRGGLPASAIEFLVKKAQRKGLGAQDAVVVALLPADASAPWFHDCVLAHAAEVRFLRQKLAYNENGRPTRTAIVAVFKFGGSAHRAVDGIANGGVKSVSASMLTFSASFTNCDDDQARVVTAAAAPAVASQMTAPAGAHSL